MFPIKFIGRRFFIFMVAYFGLIGCLSPGPIQNAGIAVFSKPADMLISAFLPQGFIVVEHSPKEEIATEQTVRILFGNAQVIQEYKAAAQRDGKVKTTVPLKEFKVKYKEFILFPLCFFWALMLATPLKWKLKLKLSCAGTGILLLFFILKLLCYTLDQYTMNPIGVYQLSGWAAGFVSKVYENMKIGVSFIVATIVWGGLALPKLKSDYLV